jgi:hypothetical protein
MRIVAAVAFGLVAREPNHAVVGEGSRAGVGATAGGVGGLIYDLVTRNKK